MIYVGIDPGLNGGIAFIDKDEKILHAVPIPIKNGEFDARTFAAHLNSFMKNDDIKVVLEKVGAMPGQGVCAMFTFGKIVGEIIAVLKVLRCPYVEVRPQDWKKVVLEGMAWKAEKSKLVIPEGSSEEKKKELQKAHNIQKAKAKKEAKLVTAKFVEKRYPTFDIRLGKKNPHDGIADAICMALYSKRC